METVYNRDAAGAIEVTERERQLLEHYRRANVQQKGSIVACAKALADIDPPVKRPTLRLVS